MKNNSRIVKDKVMSALDKYSMLDGVSSVVVGFSGGADSLCLLHLLNDIKSELGFSLVAAHINHGIRGDSAADDAEFCRSFCSKSGIDYELLEVDCVSLAEEQGISLEECGRNVRYDFFNELCKNDTYRIATAHNANDNAETLLFNLARGTGLRGASGIPRVRGNIIRPLINCTRDEIEGYCSENNLYYVTDVTNLSDEYTRNKIRHNALTVLCDVNSGAIRNITSFTENISDVSNLIKELTEQTLSDAVLDNGYYNSDILLQSHKVICSECVIELFSRLCNSVLERQKVNTVVDLLKTKGRIQVYGNIFAECFKNRFRFYIDNETVGDACVPVNLVLNERIVFNGCSLCFRKYENNSKKVNKKLLDNLVDCDKIVGKLWLRTRVEGDKINLCNRKVTKSLKKLFNELAIPVEQRDKIPVLCDDEGIVWVYSVGTDSRCRINDYSSNIMSIGGETND